ncbi:unnamed protein product [Caenorhabditis bovis]|uniref:Uncharacterized protein n=1 Tax=Caenorhabditis bovis TaxID=2654633 RepID=A0A8S1EEY0_9PELO|nr:unnamed protein product [Caenorhabditis bovis]
MSEKLPPGTLCAVCDDVATGKHYSVASCNGCKTFFRRALVNKREFICPGNKDCPVNKGVRCACRYCRLQKCLAVGMDKNSIQNDRDRIGYTKRKRRHDDGKTENDSSNDGDNAGRTSRSCSPGDIKESKLDLAALDPIAEKLTTLENNFTLLLSRCSNLKVYDTLEEALNAPSKLMQPIDCDWDDPVVIAHKADEKMPFWRQRLIALYVDWAKTFSTFRALPYTDKVAIVTNHASSFMIMCEAFRTPEHIKSKSSEVSEIVNTSGSGSSRVPSEACSSISGGIFDEFDELSNMPSINEGIIFNQPSTSTRTNFDERPIKLEPSESPDHRAEMIRLPTEYGSLPADYASWIPKDYGHPQAGHEGKPDVHNFFDPRHFCEGRPASCSFSERSMKTANLNVPKSNSHKGHSVSLSGITPVLAMMIDLVMKPFRQLNFSTTEFALLQAIMFFDPDTEGLDFASQRNVIAEQKKLLAVLYRHLLKSYSLDAANERYSSILLRIPTIRRAAAKKNESLQVLDMLQMHEMNSLVKETSLGPRPTAVQKMMGIAGAATGLNTLFTS